MGLFPESLTTKILIAFLPEKKLRQSFHIITGFTPINLAIYKQAMRHSSVASVNSKGIKDSYERLEYLGDAILGMIVSEHLFSQFPFEEEGFLTEVRAKIVNRESLNKLAQKVGLGEMLQYNQISPTCRSVFGDCIEALVGAVYLDHGFKACRAFVLKKLLKPHFDINELIATITNYKSKLLEWSQKTNKSLQFKIIDKEDEKFTAQVFLEEKAMAKGFGFSKKKAEQDAARKTVELLKLEFD